MGNNSPFSLEEFEKLLRANIAAQDADDVGEVNRTMDQLDTFWNSFTVTEREAADALTLSIAEELKLRRTST